jgi:hypothetical protein
MGTPTGVTTRTITGHLVTLLEYPRWLIDRDVDFTDCHLGGEFEAGDATCVSCDFGSACRWLGANRDVPTVNTPLEELMVALTTAADYVRREHRCVSDYGRECDCDTCIWLREASNFLRAQRHRA